MEQSKKLDTHFDYSEGLSIKLLKTLLSHNNDDSNIALSPARLQAVLVLLANWASPSIQREILQHICTKDITLEGANWLSSFDRLKATPEDWFASKGNCVPVIEQNTVVWAQKELEVNEEAIAEVADDFIIAVKQVDFRDKDIKAVIDAVIAETTHGLIKQLELQITPETVAIITDILYIKALWDSPFDECDTKDYVFYGTKGKCNVPMMVQTDDFSYQETPAFQMVTLPYRCYAKDSIRYSMRIYLPKPKNSIGDVLDDIAAAEFELHTIRQEVRLTLPKFSIESNINMNEVLREIGLNCIYDSDDVMPMCIKNLKIQNIVQQLRVDVNEHGTEAAAVTSVEMMLGCCPIDKPKPIIMRVNRPFLFEIVEEKTNTIIFTGVINNID